MDKIINLKKMLCEELENFGGRTQIDMNSLDKIDKLAHAVKNLDKVIKSGEEEEMSYRMSRDYSGTSILDGMGRYRMNPQYTRFAEDGEAEGSAERSYRRGMSRRSRRSYANEYSGHDFVQELEDLMEDAPDEQTRKDIEKLINKMR